MEENKEETQEVAWYVTVCSNGLTRTYNFDSDKERDWMYEFIIDKSLRNQGVQINDCKTGEKIFIPSNPTVIKGQMPLKLDIEGLEETQLYKKGDILLCAMGVRA